MNDNYVALLERGANEAREFARTSPDAEKFSSDWLMRLAHRMDLASQLTEPGEFERELKSIAHALVDSGPLCDSFAPSFGIALNTLQRSEKRKPRK